MNNIVNFLRSYNYDICLVAGKIWTLTEAADYLAAYLASKENWSAREDAYHGFLALKDKFLTAIKTAIDEGNLVVSEVYLESNNCVADISQHAIDADKSTVQPFILISWAHANNIDVPKEFSKYVDTKKKDKSALYESISLKKSTIHHQRCRAVAALLWCIEPEIPIAKMARRREIIEYGCEGHVYDVRTISRWLASLKADRRPGQPRKKEEL